MNGLGVELVLTTEAEAASVLRFFPAYLREVASYERRPVDWQGLPVGDDGVGSLDEILRGQAAWWTQPGILFPYLIRVDGSAAGFNLIASGPYVPTPGIDFVVHELFVAPTWRGSGAATEAARLGFARHRGAWEVATWPRASRSIAFWRKTLAACTVGEVSETEEDHPWGRRVVFRFENRRA